jgi:Family of unknown function (DUF6263)
MRRMKKLALAAVIAASLARPLAAAPSAVPADAPVVKLIDPGKDPKKALRLTAKVGLRRTMVMSMKMTMAMTMGANSVPAQKLPETRMTMDMKVTNVAPNGDIRYEFTIKKPEVIADKDANPQVVDAMKNALKGMDGMNGYAVVSSRGFTKEADINMPPNMDPSMRQLMEGTKQSLNQISSPLPEEPVGVGARWETIMKLKQNGMVLNQTASNELVDLKGDTGKINLKIKQNAERQKITQNGVTVDLISLSSTGGGVMNFDLARLVPSLATVNLSSDSQMEAMGQKMAMKLGMTMGLQGK